MTAKNRSRLLIGLLLATAASVLPSSCERIGDDMDDCGIYLEFRYDYNMEYTDSFDPQVPSVDVLVFDAQERYLFTRHSSREQLVGNKRMFLGGELQLGRYHILTVGALTDDFRVTDNNGSDPVPGKTLLHDIQIALVRGSATVEDEFSPLWVAKTMTIDYRADLSVWPVNLVKNTNRFNLILAKSDKNAAADPAAAYTFEIVTPEGAVYGHDNAPLSGEAVTYMPYRLTSGTDPGEVSAGRLNTVRLLQDAGDYRLVVRNTQTGQPLWDYDLMELLKYANEGINGAELPMQEYLDRQSQWHLVILYEGGIGGTEGFVAVAVRVNGWIIRLSEIGV